MLPSTVFLLVHADMEVAGQEWRPVPDEVRPGSIKTSGDRLDPLDVHVLFGRCKVVIWGEKNPRDRE